MSIPAQKSVHSIVLDAGPMIKNEPSVSTLLAQAEKLYTIPAVVDEIRDAVTRTRIETTLKPFLVIRTPSPASIKVIADFARRTGDLEVLSKPDIHLMALAYELECERNHGDWRLRSVPGQKGLNGKPPGTLQESPADMAKTESNGEVESPSVAEDTMPAAPLPVESIAENSEVKSLETQLESSHITTPELQGGTPSKGSNVPELPETTETIEETEDAEDSDGGEWITPSNLKEHQAKDSNTLADQDEDAKTIQVALITSDFAMQNVLLRMNLNLLSPSMQRIRQVKTWILRCHACFATTRDMTKQFCNRCGKPTLLRASCSTDKAGNFTVHLKKNMQWNTRGNVYSIPKPVAGTSNGKLAAGGGKGGWGQGLILAEDQKEYVSAMTGARRHKEKDLMDEDYLPSILSGDRKGPGGKPRVGAGKGVNSKKRRG